MLFNETLELLKSGEAVCRAKWTKEDGYLKLMPGMEYVWKVMLLPNPNAGNFIFCVEDFTADDWKKFVLEPVAIQEDKQDDKSEKE